MYFKVSYSLKVSFLEKSLLGYNIIENGWPSELNCICMCGIVCQIQNCMIVSLQLVGLAERLNELEGVRQQQEGTIIAKQQENTVASSQIRVRGPSIVNTCTCVHTYM